MRNESIDTFLCNLCKFNNYSIVYKAGMAQKSQIVRCDNCGLMYSAPRQQEADAVRRLNEEINLEVFHGVESDSNHPFYWRLIKESRQVRDFNRSFEFIDQYFQNKGEALEIGSGMGFLLSFLQHRGWSVLGLDPWGAINQFVERFHKIKTVTNTLEGADFSENSFDLIIMLHVIEHCDDPSKTIQEIYRVLKPGGLAVIETPAYDSISHFFLRHRERSLRCDGHIYFFTKKTLARLAQLNGFSVISHERVGRTLSLERLFWNLFVVFRNRRLQDFFNLGGSPGFFKKNSIYLNLGDMQRIIIRK